MAPGFRYHVITVAAIFLALGVGIIIGSSFVQSQIVDRLTRRLETLGDQFRRDIAPLRESNRAYATFVESVAPMIVANRLAGIRVALIQTGDYSDTVRHVREALEQAGAEIVSTTVISDEFPVRAPEQLPALTSQIKTHGETPTDSAGILGILAQALGHAGHEPDARALEKAGLIELSGDYSKPVSFAILIGGARTLSGSRVNEVDLPLISSLKLLVATVAAVEPSDAEISYVEALRAADIPTVDNADTDIGRIAVVLALRGPAGDYGVKQTARNGTLPPLTAP
jgi:hypothetical protein